MVKVFDLERRSKISLKIFLAIISFFMILYYSQVMDQVSLQSTASTYLPSYAKNNQLSNDQMPSNSDPSQTQNNNNEAIIHRSIGENQQKEVRRIQENNLFYQKYAYKRTWNETEPYFYYKVTKFKEIDFSENIDTFWVYFPDNSKHSKLFGRYFASHESVLKHYGRNARVIFISKELQAGAFKQYWDADFYFILARYEPQFLFEDTPALQWYKSQQSKHLNKEQKKNYELLYNEIVKLTLLFKYGGVYLDINTFLMKNLQSEQSNFVSTQFDTQHIQEVQNLYLNKQDQVMNQTQEKIDEQEQKCFESQNVKYNFLPDLSFIRYEKKSKLIEHALSFLTNLSSELVPCAKTSTLLNMAINKIGFNDFEFQPMERYFYFLQYRDLFFSHFKKGNEQLNDTIHENSIAFKFDDSDFLDKKIMIDWWIHDFMYENRIFAFPEIDDEWFYVFKGYFQVRTIFKYYIFYVVIICLI